MKQKNILLALTSTVLKTLLLLGAFTLFRPEQNVNNIEFAGFFFIVAFVINCIYFAKFNK